MTYKSSSVEQTHQIAQEIAAKIQSPNVILLNAKVGAGKTTFTQGLIKGWGSNDRAKSPTYTIHREYTAAQNKAIHHFDFYRLKEDDLLMRRTIGEHLQEDAYLVIEWPDAVKNMPIKDYIKIDIEIISESEREIHVSGKGQN